MKTLEDNCNHQFLLKIGEQEDGTKKRHEHSSHREGGYFPIGNCKSCNSTINISDKYRHMIGKIYQLKEKAE